MGVTQEEGEEVVPLVGVGHPVEVVSCEVEACQVEEAY